MKPNPFILLEYQPNGVYTVTAEAKQILSQVQNAILVLITGPTRSGKSTRLNQLIEGDTTSWNAPGKFLVAGGSESITKEFQTCGPIPLSSLNNKFQVPNQNNTQSDINIFFIDSEGIGDLNGQAVHDIFKGIIALLPIVCVTINVYQGTLHEDSIDQIVKQFQLNHLVSVLTIGVKMTRGFALMCRDVGYKSSSKIPSPEELETERVKQDKKQKEIMLNKLKHENIEQNTDTVIVLTQPNGNGDIEQKLQKNSLRDFVIFLNGIIQQRNAVSGATLIGMIEEILPNVQQIRDNEISDNIISEAFDHAVDRILTKARDEAILVCNTRCGNIKKMTLNQLIIGGSQTAIDDMMNDIDRIYNESLDVAKPELERFKSELCLQKHIELISDAKNLAKSAIDSRAELLHDEILQCVRLSAQQVRDQFIATVRGEVVVLNYAQLRNFSGIRRAENVNNANIVRQRCAERLGYLIDKVEIAVHDAANTAQREVVADAQAGFEAGLNGRIVYPHTLAETQGEYGNLTAGTNITLYTQDNIPYIAIVIGNEEITLPGLSAIRTSAHEEHGGKFWTSSNSPCTVSFLPNTSSVKVVANVFRNEWNTTGSVHWFPLPPRVPKYHQVEKADASVTIPPDWTIGNIVWGGWLSIKGQTILFTAMDGFSGEVPLIPISRRT